MDSIKERTVMTDKDKIKLLMSFIENLEDRGLLGISMNILNYEKVAWEFIDKTKINYDKLEKLIVDEPVFDKNGNSCFMCEYITHANKPCYSCYRDNEYNNFKPKELK